MYTGGRSVYTGGGVCTVEVECVHWGRSVYTGGRSVYTGGGVCTVEVECVHWGRSVYTGGRSVYTGGRSVYTGGKEQSSLWALTQAHYVCMERILYKYVCRSGQGVQW